MELEKEIDQKNFASEYHKLQVNLLYTGKWAEYRNSCFFKKWDLTGQQYNVLRILRGSSPKPATVQYLTERMLDKSSNASRLVDKLEEKGLAQRKTCPSNRRAVDVSITQTALDLLAQIDNELNGQPFSDKLTYGEVLLLNSLLDKLRDTLI
jgi:DNA-binding MarR family transcriptional regulator